jgi:hypothetical protein
VLDELQSKKLRLAEARCAIGYPMSCSFIPNNGPRIQAVAVDGCARGYLSDCDTPLDDHSVEERQLARVCEIAGGLGGGSCGRLAFIRMDRRIRSGFATHGSMPVNSGAK